MSVPYPCCSICGEPFIVDLKVARMLPCGDSFCEDCLVKDSNLTNCHECQAQNTKSLGDCPINRGLMRSAEYKVKNNDVIDAKIIVNIKQLGSCIEKCEGEIEKEDALISKHKMYINKLQNEIDSHKSYKYNWENDIKNEDRLINVSRSKIIRYKVMINQATEKLIEYKSSALSLSEEGGELSLNRDNESFEDNFNKKKKMIARDVKQQEVLQDWIRRLRDNEEVWWKTNENVMRVTSDYVGSLYLHYWIIRSESHTNDSNEVLPKPYSKATVVFIGLSKDESRRVYLQVDGRHRYGEQFIQGCLRLNGSDYLHKQEDNYYGIFKVKKSIDLSNVTCDLTIQALNKGDLFIEEDGGTITYNVCRKDGDMEGKYLGRVIDGYSYLEQDYRLGYTYGGVVLFNLN